MSSKEIELLKGDGVPPNAIPFNAVNSTVIAASASPQAIKAAVTGKKHWIRSAIYSNTGADVGENSIADGSTKKTYYVSAADSSSALIVFNPPIEISQGAAINGYAEADTGDTFISITGWVQA